MTVTNFCNSAWWFCVERLTLHTRFRLDVHPGARQVLAGLGLDCCVSCLRASTWPQKHLPLRDCRWAWIAVWEAKSKEGAMPSVNTIRILFIFCWNADALRSTGWGEGLGGRWVLEYSHGMYAVFDLCFLFSLSPNIWCFLFVCCSFGKSLVIPVELLVDWGTI